MPVNVPYRKVGDIVLLYPEGRLTGLGAGPVKTIVQEFLDEGIRNFIISFKNVLSIDSPYAAALNSVSLNIQRHDGRLILCEAGNNVLPWLEKNMPNVVVYISEDIALNKIGIPSVTSFKGNIAVVGTSDIMRELFKGISNYKGLIFNYFDDPLRSVQKVIELKPKGIILNIEHGSIVVEPLRQWRFHPDTKHCPVIVFGPTVATATARALINEGASDFVEVKYDGPPVLAYLKTIDFRNVLAKKLDMIIEGAYTELDRGRQI
jgi:anti-anti-sigma regulatory factor